MTQTIHFLSILVVAVILVGSTSVGTVAADKEPPISFSWDPADTSDDPFNRIVVGGAFARVGFLSDTTTDVQGELKGNLKGGNNNEFTKTVENTVGTSTFTTTVESHSQKAGKFQGTITIDGEEFSVKFKPSGDATILQETTVFSGPTFSQTSDGEKLTISGTVMMCNDDKECLEGFGVIRRDASQTISPTLSVIGTIDQLEAEVIGDDGLFNLNLFRSEQIITTP